MDKEQALNTMKAWYSMNAPVYEIVFADNFVRREFAVLTPKCMQQEQQVKGVRHLRITGVDSFRYCLSEVIECFSQKRVFNFYRSLATYDQGVPKMSPVLRFRGADIEAWKEKRVSQLIAYDCFIDIDSPGRAYMADAKEDATRIHFHLEEFNIPHSITFSGMGYHLIIPYNAFKHLNLSFDPDYVGSDSIYVVFNKITQWFSDKMTEFVDTDLHDSMRITKIPYTLSVYGDCVCVCWPFASLSEFTGHAWTDYRVDEYGSFRGFEPLYKRGIKLFSDAKWRPECTDALLKDMGIKVR